MNADLASLSNQFVYAAMGVYTLALISFAVALAASRGPVGLPESSRVAQEQLAAVPAGAVPTGVTRPAGPGDTAAPAPLPPAGGRETLPCR